MLSLSQRSTVRRRPFLHSPLADWDRRELFFGFFLIFILFFVVVQIKYTGADSAMNREFAGQDTLDAAGGDRFRQLYYILIFIVVSAANFYLVGFKRFIPILFTYNLACLWCLFSAVYAIDPGISVRRSIGMYIILLSVGFCIQHLGAHKTLAILRAFLASVVIASFVSVLLSPSPLFSFAVHPSDEMDAALINAWRGVMPHKNVAGAVMTHSLIFFTLSYAYARRRFDLVIAGLAMLFLIFTKSKTSTGLALIGVSFGFLYLYMQHLRSRALLHCFFAIVLLIGFILLVAGWDDVVRYFGNPDSVSGRVAIWQSVFPYVEHNLWLGSGYGSFWMIGYSSPIFNLALTEFITTIGHSHNGYMEILLSTGLIGLILALIALLVVPYYWFSRAILDRGAPYNAAFFGMWLFGMLQNLTEAQFFSPDKQSWIFVVIAITTLHHRQTSHFVEKQ